MSGPVHFFPFSAIYGYFGRGEIYRISSGDHSILKANGLRPDRLIFFCPSEMYAFFRYSPGILQKFIFG